jgi:hypothetical protein
MLINARFYFPEILFGLLLAVAIFAIGLTFQSSRQPLSKEQSSASQQQTENKSGNDSKEVQSLWIPTDSVGLYTLVLCVFTGILAIVSIFQGVMLLRSDKTARIAAEAAKKSADAVVSAELPILILHFANLTAPGISIIAAHTPLPAEFRPTISFENYGRGPAQIVAGCLEWCVASSPSELPLPPRYQNIFPYTANAVVIEKGRISLDVPCQINLNSNQLLALNTSRQFLWVFGYIAYKDFLDGPHEARFCIKWAPYREGYNGPFGFVWESETPPEYTKRS